VLTIGTVECLTVTFSDSIMSPVLMRSNLCTYSHAAPKLYATLAYHLTGGNLLRWFRDEWGGKELGRPSENANAYDHLLAEMPEEPSSLLALPYFTPSGTPYFDAVTPGAIVGLRLTTRRGEVLRGLLEGLAYEMKMNIALMAEAGIPVHEIYCVGGGARSDRWMQLIADVLGQPINRPQVTEAGCRGAAIIACSSVVSRPPSEIVMSWSGAAQRFLPRASNVRAYASRFPLYKDIYRRLAGFRIEAQ
jgi:xylulokinase